MATTSVESENTSRNHKRSFVMSEVIRREIEAKGPISFARFMELALYYPDHGYYERRLNQIGQRGDYCTNVSVGPLFGELLAFEFCRRLDELSETKPVIVECGTHDGTLASDILGWTRTFRPDAYEKIRYVIIEPSEMRRRVQSATLANHVEKVSWLRTIAEAGEGRVRGVVFANELLDSFPFHRLRWNKKDRSWHEEGVTVKNERFVWVDLGPWRGEPPIFFQFSRDATGSEATSSGFGSPSLADVMPDGFRFDYCPEATIWWQTAAKALATGTLITIDYGFTHEELFLSGKSSGTARAYQRHIVDAEILDAPGHKDLTAHVDFSSLMIEGERQGLQTEFFVPQELFLLRITRALRESGPSSFSWTRKRTRELAVLAHPQYFGKAFRVLSQVRKTVRDV